MRVNLDETESFVQIEFGGFRARVFADVAASRHGRAAVSRRPVLHPHAPPRTDLWKGAREGLLTTDDLASSSDRAR